jgi:hypothetical protein
MGGDAGDVGELLPWNWKTLRQEALAAEAA